MHRLALSLLGVAATTMFVAAPITLDRASPPTVGVSTARAATEVDINLFFTSLSPYGAWVPSPDYNYVWVPTQVDPNWSPYTNGHWVYTDRYGWYFVSDEPFAWIVYHYGRWAYEPLVGWYWVPGTQWAPAWVAWRKGDTEIGWAPLPPQGKGYQTALSVSININTVPQHYWIFTPADQFLAPQLKTVVFFGDRRPEVLRATQPVGTVIVQNNVIVNNVITVNFIQQQTKQQVAVTKVETTTDPNAAKNAQLSGSTLTAFVAPLKPADKTAKPANVVERTAVQTPTKGQADATASGPSLATTGPATANPKCSDAAFAKANPKDCATANAAANATTGAAGNAAGANATATGNAAVTGKAATPDASGKTAVQGNVNVNANPRCADAAYAKANPKTCATVTPNAAGAAGAATGPATKTPGNGAANTVPTTPPVNADTNAAANLAPKGNANAAVDGKANANATAATGSARCSDPAFAKANAKLCGTQGGNAGPNANVGGDAAANAGASANGPANGKGSVSVQGNAAASARCNDATFAKNNPTVCKVQGKAGADAKAATTAPSAAVAPY